MEKLDSLNKLDKTAGQSMDIVADNIAKLKELFPEILTENKIDFKALQALLGEEIEVEDERYSFNWHGKAQASRLAQSQSTGTLRPSPDESADWNSTKNLFIEGDNLEVLKLLQKSYHKKVKMIYIDPPYNTGSDLVYPDDFADNIQNYLELTGQKAGGRTLNANPETSGRYHTDWLNMIYPRLKLARNLLREDGAIFISIDENELANLKAICDQVFGEDNFIECITWNKRVPKNDKGIGNIHEYILVYVKNIETKPIFTMSKNGLDDINELVEKLKKNQLPLDQAENEIKKLYKKNAYDRGITLYNSLDDNYRLWGKINMSWPNADTFGPKYIVPHPKTNKPVKIPDRGWRWIEETFNEAAKIIDGKFTSVKELHDGSFLCGRIWFARDENTQPSSVNHLDEMNRFLLRSILSHKSDGGVEVESLFEGKNYFSYPKPTNLLKVLLDSLEAKDGDIYLDFFSGSGTTAHSIMLLNSEDGIKRQSVSVQLPEPLDVSSAAYTAGYRTITALAQERIRRAAQKINNENPHYQGDLGFKVFKLDSSNIKLWDADFDSLAQDLADATDVIKADRKPEDVLFEILLKYGLDLTLPIDTHSIAGKTVFEVGAGALIVCLDDGITEAVAEGIGKLKEQLEPEVMRVVFKDSSFASDAAKVNAVQVLKQYGIADVKSI